MIGALRCNLITSLNQNEMHKLLRNCLNWFLNPVRDLIWVENRLKYWVLSRMGQNILLKSSFYPYLVPTAQFSKAKFK
jgi:hypothetical protein